jgi:hypothetical protein
VTERSELQEDWVPEGEEEEMMSDHGRGRIRWLPYAKLSSVSDSLSVSLGSYQPIVEEYE